MIVGFADKGWEDYQYWIKMDQKILKRINTLLEKVVHILFNAIELKDRLH